MPVKTERVQKHPLYFGKRVWRDPFGKGGFVTKRKIIPAGKCLKKQKGFKYTLFILEKGCGETLLGEGDLISVRW